MDNYIVIAPGSSFMQLHAGKHEHAGKSYFTTFWEVIIIFKSLIAAADTDTDTASSSVAVAVAVDANANANTNTNTNDANF